MFEYGATVGTGRSHKSLIPRGSLTTLRTKVTVLQRVVLLARYFGLWFHETNIQWLREKTVPNCDLTARWSCIDFYHSALSFGERRWWSRVSFCTRPSTQGLVSAWGSLWRSWKWSSSWACSCGTSTSSWRFPMRGATRPRLCSPWNLASWWSSRRVQVLEDAVFLGFELRSNLKWKKKSSRVTVQSSGFIFFKFCLLAASVKLRGRPSHLLTNLTILTSCSSILLALLRSCRCFCLWGTPKSKEYWLGTCMFRVGLRSDTWKRFTYV